MIRLEGHGYRVEVLPERGASIGAFEYHAARGVVPILAPLTNDTRLDAGSFVMAPFANRIADGSFSHMGRPWRVPVNRPEEGMAIHGMARDRAWQVIDTDETAARLSLRVDDAALPWHFTLEQTITLSPEGLTVTLDLSNCGAAAMPFGFGLHPWFVRENGATLTFSRPLMHRRDARGLPLSATDLFDAFRAATPRPLDTIPWLDRCTSSWHPRTARITRPGAGIAITLGARDALRHLHVYVPDDRPVFCVEPASHLPDAVNRPELGENAMMRVLAPGESLSGTMTIHAAPLTRARPAKETPDAPQDL